MNHINRNNYETFFLLYADNELSVAEKKAVDEFVLSNTDLQEELVMLQQSILKPDTIVFDDKMSLLKNEVIITRMQEKLLLHLDNELTIPERNEVEGLIKADTDFENEWNVLQQTKLLPGEAIVFTDKQSLYRKEGVRVVALYWRRVAVAAVFVGFGLWGALVYVNNNDKVSDNEIVTGSKKEATHDTVKLAMRPTNAPPIVLPTLAQKAIATNQAITKKMPGKTVAKPTAKIAPPTLSKSNMQALALKEKDNNLPQPYFENVNNIGSNKTITAYVKPETQPNTIINSGDNDMAKNTGKQDAAIVYASAVSFTDNIEDKNNNRILFMDEEKIKKSKLGGIFRKVKRALERSANIKPGGNNIKVANLEFAIQ